jgi:cation-transporting ATPase 13A3/4/5
MLTGESLPVSKTPIPEDDLGNMDFEKEEPASSARMQKYFLFSGTQVIRARNLKPVLSRNIAPNGNSVDGRNGLVNGGSPNGTSGRNGLVNGAAIIANGIMDGEEALIEAQIDAQIKNVTKDRDMAIALVVRTGFNTAQGSLIRSMLFPKPNTFKFYEDSFKFILVLAGISFLGFIYSLYNFLRLKVKLATIIIRALDLVTIAVPPALPATMAVGTTFAIKRLREAYIYCTSPPRVIIAGKIDIMCFDKTGTLTEEGLDVLGIRFTVPQQNLSNIDLLDIDASKSKMFSPLYTSYGSSLPNPKPRPLNETPKYEQMLNDPDTQLVRAMASCHSIKIVNEGDLIGDPLDLKMFHFTGWRISEEEIETEIPTETLFEDGAGQFAVVKEFEFMAALRRMSVITFRMDDTKTKNSLIDFECFVKGAPEIIESICLEKSIPDDYTIRMNEYTHHGYRVIAIAAKTITTSYDKVMKIGRKEVESDLGFVGFVVFENKLKPGTIKVIKKLTEANIIQVMVTGDNVLTACSVSRECGIVTKRVFWPKLIGFCHEENARIIWEDLEDPTSKLDSVTLKVFYILISH